MILLDHLAQRFCNTAHVCHRSAGAPLRPHRHCGELAQAVEPSLRLFFALRRLPTRKISPIRIRPWR
ncbi:hypothetical protein M8494_31110 [Serratia ureilytica]